MIAALGNICKVRSFSDAPKLLTLQVLASGAVHLRASGVSGKPSGGFSVSRRPFFISPTQGGRLATEAPEDSSTKTLPTGKRPQHWATFARSIA